MNLSPSPEGESIRLTLKRKLSAISPAKMVLFRNRGELQSKTSKLRQNYRQAGRTKERKSRREKEEENWEGPLSQSALEGSESLGRQ